MRHVIYRAIPFVLTLTIGIVVHGLLGWFVFRGSPQSSVSSWIFSEPVTIVSVPEVDFPQSLEQWGSFWTRIELRALFDADGQVKQIIIIDNRLANKLSAEVIDVLPKTIQGRLVDVTLRDVVLTAMDQLRRTKFKPRKVNGQPVAEWVTVETTFAYNFGQASRDSSIKVKMSSDNLFWQGDTWKHTTNSSQRLQ